MMIEWVIQWYEKRQTGQKEWRSALGRFAGCVGLLSNLLLFVSKFLIGLLSGSVSITADAMNNLSDTVSSILTLIGFYISGKPADEEHPYGHERFEYISGMMVSVLITFVGLQFLLTSIDRIRQPQSINVQAVTLIVLFLSILVKVWQSLFYKKVGRKIASNTLIATAKDSLNDVFTTITVLASAAVEWLTGFRIDGVVGLLIAIYIIWSGIQLLREFINELLGTRPSQPTIDAIRHALKETTEIVGYHDLLIHQYGPSKTFASVHIEIDDRWSLPQAHEVIDAIEERIRRELGIDLVCHIDPVNLHDQHQHFVYVELKKIIKNIDSSLKVHDIRCLTFGEKGRLLFDLVVPPKLAITDRELQLRIQEQVYRFIGEYEVGITFDHAYLL